MISIIASIMMIFSVSCKESPKEVISNATTVTLISQGVKESEEDEQIAKEVFVPNEDSIISETEQMTVRDKNVDVVILEEARENTKPLLPVVSPVQEVVQKDLKVINKNPEIPSERISKEVAEVIEIPRDIEENMDEISDEVKSQSTAEVVEQNEGLHESYDVLLKKYVSSNGKVDYAGLASEINSIDNYLASLSKVKLDDLTSRDEKLAFWINAYNAFTIKLILKNYPVKSITDLHDGKPWDVKWISLDGKTLSLNNIENDIIRPTFKDARIHFAVNCAAKSCPPLLNRAYRGTDLDQTLESQTKKFINNTTYNTIGTSEISISKIFDWYAVDFGDINTYINKYTSTDTSNSKISYQEYNWELNN